MRPGAFRNPPDEILLRSSPVDKLPFFPQGQVRSVTQNPSGIWSLQARIVCPISGPAIEGGVVEIADGLVGDLHDRPHARTIDLGNVALLPGLVNCHTHLEFSNLERPLGPPAPFAAWIGSVVGERRRRCRLEEGPVLKGRAELDPLGRGLEECFRSGAALVADIVTGAPGDADDRLMLAWAMHHGRLIPFRELLAPRSSGVEGTWKAADDYMQAVTSEDPGACIGLSPHAPYTVTSQLLIQAVTRAVKQSRPVAMHVAETREELEILEHRSGPLAQMLERIGQWDPAAMDARRPLDILHVLSDAPRALVVHGNYLAEEELSFLGAQPQMSLVYCPRTHSYFEHPRYPLENALRLNVHVALGTDSRASNPDLSLWEEVKTVARTFPRIDVATILMLATMNGARALGKSSTHGVLEPGRVADLCCVRLDAGCTDPLQAVVGPGSTVVGAMQSGRWLVAPEGVNAW